MKSEKLDVINKLKVMAKRGEPNERKIAKVKLKEFEIKYRKKSNVNNTNEVRRKRIFKVHNWHESKNILFQIIREIEPKLKITGIKKENKISIAATNLEYNTISKLFDFYWKAYLIEKEIFTKSYILKNVMQINSDNYMFKKTDNEEIDSILKYIYAIKESTYKQTKYLS